MSFRPFTPRMIERAMIDRAGKKFNTAVERGFQAFTDLYGLPFKMNESRDFQALNRRGQMQTYSFQMDFVEFLDLSVFQTWKVTRHLPPNAPVKTDLEVDGDGHVDKNDPWKDAVKNRYGIRVIHTPGYLCKKQKMWPDLCDYLGRARRLPPRVPERTIYLDEYSR